MISMMAELIRAALEKIGATEIEKKVKLAIKLIHSQAAVDLILDSQTVTGIAVDIATVFSLDGHFSKYRTSQGAEITIETMHALSIVLVCDQIHLCKSTYDVIPGDPELFVNCRYWTTTLEDITENYIC